MAIGDCDFRFNREYIQDKKNKMPKDGVIAPGQEEQDWKYYRNTSEANKEITEYLDSIPENKNKE